MRARRRTVALEWWRGPANGEARRPSAEDAGTSPLELQEPATRALADASGLRSVLRSLLGLG